MPRTKRPKPLYQRGAFALHERVGRANLEIVWYDAVAKRERSASAGTSCRRAAELELDRRYLAAEGRESCPTCHRPYDGHSTPLLLTAIKDYLLLSEGHAGFKGSTRNRLSHAIEYCAHTDPAVTVPQIDQRWIDGFRKWLAARPVISPTGKRLRARSLSHVEGCVRQLAAAINATPGQRAQFKAEQAKTVSRSPAYRADISTLAAMFRFCIDPPQPEKLARGRTDRPWTEKERAMVIATRLQLLRYLRAAVATWARPDAIYDILPAQWLSQARVLDLNPPGRRQTKKHRPMIAVPRQFAPWLDEMLPGPDPKTEPGRESYLSVSTIRHGWDAMRSHLALPAGGEAGEKLIRRSMATIARRMMGEENWRQGEIMLGHVKASISDIYAVRDPANLGRALAATESIIDQIEALCPGAFYRTVTAPEKGLRIVNA